MNRRTLAWWLLGILGCVLFAAWIYSQLERETVTIDTPGSAEARRNPLLAATRFMQAMDQQVQAVAGSQPLLEPPGSDDVLLLYRSRTPLDGLRLQALLDWVEQGGRLIMDVAQLWDERIDGARSPLLEELDVGLWDMDLSGAPAVDVHFDGEQQPVPVQFKNRFVMFDQSDRSSAGVANEDGYLLLQFERGLGRITLINDLYFLDNDNIGDAEHAHFLYQLSNADGTLWLLYDPYRPNLADLIWQHARALLLSLLLLGVVWLWMGNRRLGPLLASPAGARRNLLEHLDAQGAFDWRHGLSAARFHTTQQQVMQQWLMQHPQLAVMQPAQRAEWIGVRTGLAADKVYRALFEDYLDELDFIRRSIVLQQLRNPHEQRNPQ